MAYSCKVCKKIFQSKQALGGHSSTHNFVRETVNCPICEKPFERIVGSKRAKTTCSYACSNTFFRSQENNGCFKQNKFRPWKHHKKKCVVCGETKIVAVHHYDENHNNNVPENIVPLCPTHHQYWHSKYRELVREQIETYHKKFLLGVA